MENGNGRRICLGLLAHVDAGKTTLSEAMLYRSGALRAPGRVDHRDCFLDTHSLERQRGITIFSKQAVFSLEKSRVTLLDTPGHVDFAAEAERTLPVLDAAVLVISATDAVQAHTETLWKLLGRYRIPCFVFISKMDLPNRGREALMSELRARLGEGCVDYAAADRDEQLALLDEAAMEDYLSAGALSGERLRELIEARRFFPCFFGSGLKAEGVDELLLALDRLVTQRAAGERFGARVYKIAHDPQGRRLSYVRLTGGSLSVRQSLSYGNERGEEREEKLTGIRLYSGEKFENLETAVAGDCVALLGLSETWPGLGLGALPNAPAPVLEPVLSYRLLLPPSVDARLLLPKLRLLQEEDPQLHLVWNERSRQISVRLMGRVQTEVLKSLILERFDVAVSFDKGSILYRETIADTVEGVGHFEPLRHYAEVHLLLEPLPRGSGLVFDSVCPEDELDRNWQRLILTHLAERPHPGVLTGAPITDMKLTLTAGRAHIKHTEGGDFRQATYRAVRQGLMQAKSVLLEPWYAFTIELPAEQLGRAISDLRAMGGEFDSPETLGESSRLTGAAPVAAFGDYAETLSLYSRGRGRLSLRPEGYRPCSRSEKVVAELGYDPERDTENPADSVFCAHGGGFLVRWDKVKDYMHLETTLPKEKPTAMAARPRSFDIDERELEAIMEREFGPIRRPSYAEGRRNEAPSPPPAPPKPQTLIVDGYNLIFSWPELKELARQSMDLARERLEDMLVSYAAFTRAELVLVYDAYRRIEPAHREARQHLRVAYTADGETADAYIERLADEIGRNYRVRVVTSDSLIRLSALRSGVLRSSSKEFEAEVRDTLRQIEQLLAESNRGAHVRKVKDGNAGADQKS